MSETGGGKGLCRKLYRELGRDRSHEILVLCQRLLTMQQLGSMKSVMELFSATSPVVPTGLHKKALLAVETTPSQTIKT
jgi:hypothetical protein